MQNYHRHSSYSNILTNADSACLNEEYAKRAVEVGHKVISSVEHGWQGYYYETYELAHKYGLKCVIGAEAYWVKDRQKEYLIDVDEKTGEEKWSLDRSNNHIILLAKNNNGRESINDILSEASLTGFYRRPRIDLDLLMSLPPDDVLITTACIAFDGYTDIDSIIFQIAEYFGKNFMLEVQYHNTEKQKIWNAHLVQLSRENGIEMIAGLDSHYIYPEDNVLRDDLLASRGTHYDDEIGWYLDYPDDATTEQRFVEQNVLTHDEIKRAMSNCDVTLEFADYDAVKIFQKDIKLPTLYPDKTTEEKNEMYRHLINDKLDEYLKDIPIEEHQKYRDAVDMEVQTYIDTGMVDYPLLDYEIVKDAVAHGGLITDSGRGSAVGYMTNSLCGFSSVDRLKADIKLYPERFISTTRILETKSLPDIDLNVGTVSIFKEAQEHILGKDHAVPMIAFGTLKKKAAFKLYAKSQGIDFSIANIISNQISEYDEAVKNADDDDKADINIYDYVDERYRQYIERSERYWGVISDKKQAPSAYLLYQGDIRREIGLIKCKSESTGKEVITCVIDGAIAENYKFLKNDILKVDVVLLIDEVFKRIGINHFSVPVLLDKIKNDEAVWDIYANGYTIGINQVEKEGSREKCRKYKPHNISELSAFVAAIRPGFKSMYKRFENREDFSWGIPALDNLLRTEQLPVSFLFFQEQVMAVLNYAGFPMDQCYGIIKAIAKKHPEKVKPLKAKFIDGFKQKLIDVEGLSESEAQDNADKVWTIVNDNCGYSFNSSHAYCMALDSLYQAWQKAHYPYEFYETLLQFYTDKGKKDKVQQLKGEMQRAFGIQEGAYDFGADNRKFTADKEHGCIYPALSSIKQMNNIISEELFALKDNAYNNLAELLVDIKDKTSINSGKLNILIRIGYFKRFGSMIDVWNFAGEEKDGGKKVKSLFAQLYGKKTVLKSKADNLGISHEVMEKFSQKSTEKSFLGVDTLGLLNYLWDNRIKKEDNPYDLIAYQKEYLGYIQYTNEELSWRYVCVTNLDTRYSPKFSAYCLQNGNDMTMKIHKKKPWKDKSCKTSWAELPLQEGDIIYVSECKREPKRIKKDDDWITDETNLEWWIKDYKLIYRKQT